MRGTIIHYANNEGIISGQNGERYAFSSADLQNDTKPKSGMEIDFQMDGNNAKNIFFMSPKSEKSKIIMIFLLIFLGGFGAHRFYANKYLSGFVMLALTVIYLFLLFSFTNAVTLNPNNPTVSFLHIAVLISLFLFVWIVIDFIVIVFSKFKDSKGNPIS